MWVIWKRCWPRRWKSGSGVWSSASDFNTDLKTSGTDTPFTVSDATPGGKLRLYGDLNANASAVSKSVGFTWSDPAVGPLNPNRTTNVAIVGSGYFPDVEGLLPARAGDSPLVKAGRTFYLVDMVTGRVLGNPTSCIGSIGCKDVGDASNPAWKNALQADPTDAGSAGSYVVNKAYLGDLDGRYWKFTFNDTGNIDSTALVSTGQPIYNSSALLMVFSCSAKIPRMQLIRRAAQALEPGADDVLLQAPPLRPLLPLEAGGGIQGMACSHVLKKVPDRHFVFSLPRILRRYFLGACPLYPEKIYFVMLNSLYLKRPS